MTDKKRKGFKNKNEKRKKKRNKHRNDFLDSCVIGVATSVVGIDAIYQGAVAIYAAERSHDLRVDVGECVAKAFEISKQVNNQHQTESVKKNGETVFAELIEDAEIEKEGM